MLPKSDKMSLKDFQQRVQFPLLKDHLVTVDGLQGGKKQEQEGPGKGRWL